VEVASLSPLKRPVAPKRLAIAYGSAELPALAQDARNFHALRAGAGAPGELIVVEGADHFTILDELRRPDGALARAARALMEDDGDA
jgi:arylformamidase